MKLKEIADKTLCVGVEGVKSSSEGFGVVGWEFVLRRG